MNFHGATLPRGWQRTYPHLMTMEAMRGLEFVTFEQKNAEEEPTHAAMLPFTRNVFDPMDFTPVVLDRIQQHRAADDERLRAGDSRCCSLPASSTTRRFPKAWRKRRTMCREFLPSVPSVWDDVRFLDGYPGNYVVIARQGDGKWYVAGINAQNTSANLRVSLAGLMPRGSATVITDGDGGNLSFRKQAVKLAADGKLDLTVKARGGFVILAD